MKNKFTARISAFLIAATIAAGAAAALPASATYNNSTTSQFYSFYPAVQTYLMAWEQHKFPAGKYWNGGNPNSYTSTPCNGHTNDNHFIQHNIYSAGYTSYIGAVNGSQCYGFAAKLAYDFFGGADAWIRFSNPTNFQFRVGDIVRIGNDQHSVFVTEVSGSSLKIADCNAGGTCVIRWNVSATYSNNKINLGGTNYKVYWVERPIMAGDVNGDSKVDSNDISIISSIVNGTYSFSGKQKRPIKEAADLDNNGVVNSADLSRAYSQWKNYGNPGYLHDEYYLTNVGYWS